VRLAAPRRRTVPDRTAVPRLRTAVEAVALTAGRCRPMAAGAAELLRMAVEAVAELLQGAEAEVTFRLRATAQAVVAEGLLMAGVAIPTAVTNLIL
jgi:hypothetical protein